MELSSSLLRLIAASSSCGKTTMSSGDASLVVPFTILYGGWSAKGMRGLLHQVCGNLLDKICQRYWR